MAILNQGCRMKRINEKLFVFIVACSFLLPCSASSEDLVFDLRPVPGSPTALDFNADCVVTLADALIALKSTAGISAEVNRPDYVAGGNRIGTETVIYILRILGDHGEIRTCTKTGVISPEERQNDNFSNAGDADWFMFHGEAGKPYTIEIRNPEERCDPVIELYDADGDTLLKRTQDELASNLEWKCEEEGIYLVKVKNADPEIFGENTGYEISADCQAPWYILDYEADNTCEQASTIVTDDLCPQHHNFHDAADVDWVKFSVEEPGASYDIVAKNVGSASNVRLALYKEGCEETLRSETGGFGRDEVTMGYTFETEGTYYVKVINVNSDASAETSEYELSVRIPNAPLPGGIVGLARSYDKEVIPDMTITIRKITDDSDGRPPYYSDTLGIYYSPWLESDTYRLSFQAVGYTECYAEEEIGKRLTRRDVFMEPCPDTGCPESSPAKCVEYIFR